MPLSSSAHIPLHPPKTNTTVIPEDARHLVPFLLLLSFTSPLLLRMSYLFSARCNISVSDMGFNTSVNSCSLLLWAMLLGGKPKITVCRDWQLLPSEPLPGYETLLSGISALTPNEQSQHKYTCTVNTFTHCWFAITDLHSWSKMALATHKVRQQFSSRKMIFALWDLIPVAKRNTGV